MRRFFNDDERWELYYRAGGKCQICSMELHGIFEADHIVPYSKGGTTTMDNGQVLCERCNGMKSDKYTGLKEASITLRYWQEKAFDVFMSKRARHKNVLINATPGAGKTIFALYVAHSMMLDRSIDRIVVVVPTDELRRQWQTEAKETFGIELASVFDSGEGFAPDYHGIVTTYSTINKRHENYRKSIRNLLSGHKSLAIIDEIHHVGEGLNWSLALEDALEDCVMRLSITGTPFRSDRNRIPYVEYTPSPEGPISKADFSYGYGEALRDGVVRPVYFQTFDGDISWLDGDGKLIERTFAEKLSSRDASIRLRMALRTDGDWLTSVLKEANEKLEEMRRTDSRAGGLVVAKDTEHAWAIAQVMSDLGVKPIVVTSLLENGDLDQAASDKLNAYKKGTTPWIVAVKMVSEGIDIKRLRVGVWATNIQTEMFFRQVLGRILRVDSDGIDDQYAVQYIPKVEPITTFAETVKKERHHVIDDLDAIEELLEELRRQKAEQSGWNTNGAQLVSAYAEKSDMIVDEDSYTPDEIETAKRTVCLLGEMPTDKNITYTARLMRMLSSKPEKEAQQQATNGGHIHRSDRPLEQRKKDYTKMGGVLSRLRSAIQDATEGQLTHDIINRSLNRWQNVVTQSACTLEQLEERAEILKAWRKACDNGTWREFTPERHLRQFAF